MIISYNAFHKRFGQETVLCLTNGVKYNAWHVSREIINKVCEGMKQGEIKRKGNLTIKRDSFSALFYNNETNEKLALIVS